MNENAKLVVEFRQQFTVTAPDDVDTEEEARSWWNEREQEAVREVVDPRIGEVTVLHATGGD